MKLIKLEEHPHRSIKYSRLFFKSIQTNFRQGYSKIDYHNGTLDKRYWLNDDEIGFELWNNKKHYYI